MDSIVSEFESLMSQDDKLMQLLLTDVTQACNTD